MQLAQCGRFDSIQALKKHRKINPAHYERVFQNDREWLRYYADSQEALKGEALKQRFKTQGEPFRFVYFEKVDESHWYSCAIDANGRISERFGPLEALMDTMGYDLHHAKTVYLADDIPSHRIDDTEESELSEAENRFREAVEGKAIEKVLPLTDEQLSDFYLAPVATFSWKIPLIIGVVMASVLGASVMWFNQSIPEIPTESIQIIVNEKQRYQQEYPNKVLVAPALLNARNLLIESAFMPKGMSGKSITLMNNKLVMPISGDGKMAEQKEAWWKRRSLLSQYLNAGRNQLEFPVSHVPPWVPMDKRQYQRDMIQALEWLGATITRGAETMKGDISVVPITLSYQGSAGGVFVLAQWLDTPVVSLSRLSIVASETLEFTINLSIELQGIHRE